jgi:phospholipid transport system substrate-binding protein
MHTVYRFFGKVSKDFLLFFLLANDQGLSKILRSRYYENRNNSQRSAMRNFWTILLVIFLAGQYVNADDKAVKDPNVMPLDKWDIAVKDPGNPNELMEAKWNSVVNVLNDKQLDLKSKAVVIDRIINPVFDFELMGILALGKTNWPKLNTAQREKFLSLFVERLKISYRDKIMMYEDQKAIFDPAVKNKDNVRVPMTLTSKDQKTALLYKLRKADKSWKVYDVEIEGVSILLTYRSQFDDILSRGTIDDLLLQLEKPADS